MTSSTDLTRTTFVRDAALPVALTLGALLVRLPGLGASFYGDEIYSVTRDSSQWLTDTDDSFRPVFFTLLYFWRKLGFESEAGLRALPLLFGVLQVPVAFALGKLLAGRTAAGVFALLVALNPVLIEFSQELRMYSLVPLLSLAQALAFVTVQARAEAGRSTVGPWSAFVAAGVLGVYTHLHYWFLIAGFGVALLRRRRSIPLLHGAIAFGAIVALYLPNLPNLLRFQSEAGGAPHLTTADLPSALPKFVVACSVGFNYFVLPDMGIDRAVGFAALAPNLGLAAIIAIPSLVVAFGLWRGSGRRRALPLSLLALELFVVPGLVAFVATAIAERNFIHPKYMVASAPFLSLLVAAGFLAVESKRARIAAAALGLLGLSIAWLHFNQPTHYGRREDWRGLATYLRGALRDDSALVWLANPHAPDPPPTPKAPAGSSWEYYAPDLQRRIRLIRPERPGTTQAMIEQRLLDISHGARDVYYVWHEIARNVDDPSDRVLSAARHLFEEQPALQLNPRLVVYRFRTRAPAGAR